MMMMVMEMVMMVMMVVVVVTANGLVCAGIVISSALGSIVAGDAWSLWGPVSPHRSSLALICTSAIFSVSCDLTKAEKPYLICCCSYHSAFYLLLSNTDSLFFLFFFFL